MTEKYLSNYPIFYNCDKCGVDIGLNEPYIAITHNKEIKSHDIARQTDVIQVKDSILINVLCGKCGNQHSAAALAENLKQIKTTFHNIQSPIIPVQQKTKL